MAVFILLVEEADPASGQASQDVLQVAQRMPGVIKCQELLCSCQVGVKALAPKVEERRGPAACKLNERRQHSAKSAK